MSKSYKEMKRLFRLRSKAAIVLLFCAGLFVVCTSTQDQEHETSSKFLAERGRLEIEPPTATSVSSKGKEANYGSNTQLAFPGMEREVRSLSPPEVWATSSARSKFVPGHKERAQNIARQMRPNIKIDTDEGCIFFGTRILLKIVSSLTAIFKRALNSQGFRILTDSNANSLLSASEGKLSKHGRSLLRDISPPGTWPITSHDDEVEVFRRSLLASDSSQDDRSGEEPLSSSGTWRRHGRALLRDISPPGMWPITSDDDEFEIQHRRSLLSDSTSAEQSTMHDHHHKHRRSLLRDISPPGMWPITSDDDEFEIQHRRSLLSDGTSPEQSTMHDHHHKHRRSLLRDISPPGMWPITSDDDEFEIQHRRSLLSDGTSAVQSTIDGQHHKHGRSLLRDISPPGMWPTTSDDDEFEIQHGRSLLSEGASPERSTIDGQYHKHRRSLLRDISPPGMWPITSDDDEFEVSQRRALLSDSVASFPAHATSVSQRHMHRRSLLRDISPPGMWPVTPDDDEFEVTRRRSLLSDGKITIAAQATANDGLRHKHERSLLRDISPPGMWPTADEQGIFAPKRSILSDSNGPAQIRFGMSSEELRNSSSKRKASPPKLSNPHPGRDPKLTQNIHADSLVPSSISRPSPLRQIL